MSSFACGHVRCKENCPHLFKSRKVKNEHEKETYTVCNSPLCGVCFMFNNKEVLHKLFGKKVRNDKKDLFVSLFNKIVDHANNSSDLRIELIKGEKKP
jgi:hypothetical protein